HLNARIWSRPHSPLLVRRSQVGRSRKWNSESLATLEALQFSRLINLDKDNYAVAFASTLRADSREGFVMGKFGESEPANDRAKQKFLTGIFDDVSVQNRKDYPTELFEICGYEYDGEEYQIDIPTG